MRGAGIFGIVSVFFCVSCSIVFWRCVFVRMSMMFMFLWGRIVFLLRNRVLPVMWCGVVSSLRFLLRDPFACFVKMC